MRTRGTLILAILLVSVVCALPRPAAAGCPEVLAFLADKAIGAACFHADDLRVPNPAHAPVTPANNSITTFADGTPLPGPTSFGSAFSFTPVTDLGVISNGPAPTSGPVPGIQVEGWFAHDPSGEARFLLRFPDTWNGKLVIAGASGRLFANPSGREFRVSRPVRISTAKRPDLGSRASSTAARSIGRADPLRVDGPHSGRTQGLTSRSGRGTMPRFGKMTRVRGEGTGSRDASAGD